jgi:hypothetical protein
MSEDWPKPSLPVLHDDIGALAEQDLGGVGFLAGIIPAVHPDDLDLEVGVHRLRA